MLQSRTSALLAFAALLASIAVPLALGGCTPSASSSRDRAPVDRANAGVLSSMGFGLTDDGDPLTSSGTLSATFDAPVLDYNVGSTVEALGTAHVVFDDATRDVDAAAIIGAYPDSDVAYAVLFENEAPWRYVVVAAHEGALTAGATITLDGESAAALVVDEETGSGYLSQSGTLTISTSSLVDGGTLVGAVDAELVEVGLDAWPEALFPFSSSGTPSEQAPSSGGGSFDTGTGTANVTVDVEGWPTFNGTFASQEPADDQTSFIVITGTSEERRAFVLYVDNGAIADGAALSLGGYVAGAALFEEDGTQLAFTAGSLAITTSSPLTGSVTITGEAYVIPADAWSGEGEGEPPFEEEDCTGLDALAATFAPSHVYVEEGLASNELPEGYDTVLTFADASENSMLGMIVETGADYATSFGVVAYDGSTFPTAVLGLSTCNAYVEIDGGSLAADIVPGADGVSERMVGTLDYTVDGEARTLALDVDVRRF
jgi:hypothetical protein